MLRRFSTHCENGTKIGARWGRLAEGGLTGTLSRGEGKKNHEWGRLGQRGKLGQNLCKVNEGGS